MTTQNAETTAESRLKEMEEENELLLLQLHQVQEELERYYLRNQELEKGRGAAPQSGQWVDEELPVALSEVQRLCAIVDVQAKVHQLEAQHALNVRLGNVLIQSAESTGGLLSVPAKLMKMWRESTRTQPPSELGGEGFDKVIAAFGEEGFEAVEKLLAGAAIPPVLQANAYTALARHLKNVNSVQAAEAARRAHGIDPKAYRLKWLAFRLYDAGEMLEADAMLDVLPQDTRFSDSEIRQVDQIRIEAKNARLREARRKSGYSERRAEAERQWNILKRTKEEQSKLAAERGRELETLKQAQARLEGEKKSLSGQNEEQTKLATARGLEIEALKQAQAKLEQEGKSLIGRHEEQLKLAAERDREIEALKQVQTKQAEEKKSQAEENELLLLQLHQVQEELEHYCLKNQELEKGREADLLSAQERDLEIEALRQAQSQLEEEWLELAGQYEEQSKVAAERGLEIEALRELQSKLAEEKRELSGRYEEQSKVAAERGLEIEALRELQSKLEEAKTELSGRYEEQLKLTVERDRELEALKQSQSKLEEEKTVLAGRYEEQLKLAAERDRELELLKQSQAKLEQEKTALAGRYEQQSKVAVERLKQINELQQQIQNRQAGEADLAARQQLMHEEMVRAEAQLDLIKDMLLREPGI